MVLVGNALKPGFPGLPWAVLVVRMEGKCKCKWAAVSLRRRLNWRIVFSTVHCLWLSVMSVFAQQPHCFN